MPPKQPPDTPLINYNRMNRYLTDRIRINRRFEKVNVHFGINPWKKAFPVPEKVGVPCFYPLNRADQLDPDILATVHYHFLPPKQKQAIPLTESQEVGWYSEPVMRFDRSNPSLFYPIRMGEIGYFNELDQGTTMATKNIRLRLPYDFKYLLQ